MLTPLKILKNPRDQWKWLTLKEKIFISSEQFEPQIDPHNSPPPPPPPPPRTHPVLLVLTKDYVCSALDITIGRFLSEAENALATNSTFVYLNILRLPHPVPLNSFFRNLPQAMKNLHTLYQPYLTTVFSKIFFCKFTCYNTNKLAFHLYVLW